MKRCPFWQANILSCLFKFTFISVKRLGCSWHSPFAPISHSRIWRGHLWASQLLHETYPRSKRNSSMLAMCPRRLNTLEPISKHPRLVSAYRIISGKTAVTSIFKNFVATAYTCLLRHQSQYIVHLEKTCSSLALSRTILPKCPASPALCQLWRLGCSI